MVKHNRKKIFEDRAEEIGVIRKDWGGRVRVALVYPNTYYIGMSNLGVQTVYHLFNQLPDVVCERFFLPDNSAKKGASRSLESKRPLTDFDIIAFSISFESDYLNILALLDSGNIPLLAAERTDANPLVMAGGVACFLNPEPIAPFMDAFIIGEVEPLVRPFFEMFDPGRERRSLLKEMAQNLPGIYVPEFYEPIYDPDSGGLCSVKRTADVPKQVTRVYLSEMEKNAASTTVLTPDTTFGDTFLLEVGRGCPHACRFCSAGYIYRPPRFQSTDVLAESMKTGASLTRKIGLVGTAVSDLPGIDGLCSQFSEESLTITFSSLRADALNETLVKTLKDSHLKTATIAPDAGSERLRRVINKGLDEKTILDAASKLVDAGIPNLKLYFMVGLPTETWDDVEAIIILCRKIKARFLESSRKQGYMGNISVSLNAFVPKPMTPFQWVGMDSVSNLKKKVKFIQKAVRQIPNMQLTHDSPKHAAIQALLARGDRRVGDLLLLAHKTGGSWKKAIKDSPVEPEVYVSRQRHVEEYLPWDIIDHKVKKTFLWKEYQLALKEKISSPCPMKDCSRCGVCENGLITESTGPKEEKPI